MSNTAPIGPSHTTVVPRVDRVSTSDRQDRTPASERGRDRVELSETARLLSRIAQLPDVRQDLIDRVRAELADGTYESDERLEAALDGLLEDLADTE